MGQIRKDIRTLLPQINVGHQEKIEEKLIPGRTVIPHIIFVFVDRSHLFVSRVERLGGPLGQEIDHELFVHKNNFTKWYNIITSKYSMIVDVGNVAM